MSNSNPQHLLAVMKGQRDQAMDGLADCHAQLLTMGDELAMTKQLLDDKTKLCAALQQRLDEFEKDVLPVGTAVMDKQETL